MSSYEKLLEKHLKDAKKEFDERFVASADLLGGSLENGQSATISYNIEVDETDRLKDDAGRGAAPLPVWHVSHNNKPEARAGIYDPLEGTVKPYDVGKMVLSDNSPVEMAFREAWEAVSLLSIRANELEYRLTSILHPEEVRPAKDPMPNNAEAKTISAQILDLTYSIHDIHRRIDSICGRLEV